ncbi:hypothetical protein B9Z55_013461 [Caenorhabditis nigoni]|uniref:Innexin n=1 Tax=Caenorhabditis nigoni TaxID=1611254 RepID=A0A2G5U1T3_9PELO|nr:hypothetical protein B9Z55_013461 [Caenorhabditis nigoni]
MFVFRVLNTVPYTNRTGAKDLVASVHSFLTSNLLVGLAVLISWKQFGGTPIECMVPLDFTSAWVQYSNNYCWAQPTYFIPFTSELVEQVIDPDDVVADGITVGGRGPVPRYVKKGGEKISYYQWMSFFLLFEAACFRLPCFIWKYFASQSGMQVGEILRVASDENNAVPMVKKANIDALCIHLRGVLRFQKRLKLKKIVPHKILRFLNIKYSAYYVTFIYFVAKVAFLLNVILQSNLLNKYMLPHDRQQNFGFDMWKSIFYGGNGNESWRESGVFPRVTLCDFETRDMGNVQMHTVQCVLLLNLFTEKIFVFLWAWYILLGAFTVGNLFSWLFAVFNQTYNEHFILNHLEMCETPFDKDDIKNREHVNRFISLYLGTDGLFLLQLIAQHADVVFTTELTAALFKSYIEIEAQRATLKQMNAVLPLLRPKDAEMESAMSTAPSTSHNQRRRGTEQMEKTPKGRQGSISTQLRPFNSFEEPDAPTKKFDDSSSDEEKSSKKSSKKHSPTKKKESPGTSSGSPRRPSLARTGSPAFNQLHLEDHKLPKTSEKKHW